MTRNPAPNAIEFEPEFVAGLKEIFEEKILFNLVLGLKITSLKPERVIGRIEMKRDLIARLGVPADASQIEVWNHCGEPRKHYETLPNVTRRFVRFT